MINNSDDLNYPNLTVRGSSNINTGPNITINNVQYKPYYLIFNGNGESSKIELPVSYTINILCIGNVNTYNGGTKISHHTKK